MRWKRILTTSWLILFGSVLTLFSGCGGSSSDVQLLNVSYDPTRELYKEINEQFVKDYEKKTGKKIVVKQSHGGSGAQAGAIIEGLDADVATLALWSDTDLIRAKGLLKDGWEDRLPHKSLPYYSTIVFVVRKGNPKGIKDWPDILKEDVGIITPNPQTSGNGQLSFLAAWGAVLEKGGSEEDAKAFVTKLYQQTKVLDAGARGSTVTFAQRKIGDVHLTWENEAHLEVDEAKGELEIVYPSVSIKAEPFVAVVDANVDRKGTRAVAEAYLNFLYTDEAQEIVAKKFYRPINEKILANHVATLPPLKLFTIDRIDKAGWAAVRPRFFDQGKVFDQIFQKKT